MRDNWNIEEITDQAWEKMETMLDQEMPVNSGRKRRPFLWLFLLTGLILLGVGALWFWPTPPETILPGAEIQNRTMSQSPIAKNEKPAKSSHMVSENPQINQPKKGSTVHTDQEKKKTDFKTSAASALEQSIKTSVYEAPVKKSPSSNSPENALNGLQNEATENPEVVTVNPNPENNLLPKPDQVAPSDNSLKMKEKDYRLFTVENLPPVALHPLELPANPLNVSNKLYHPKKSLWLAPELQLGGISGQLNGIDGLFTEVRTGFKFRNTGKWSLHTGLGFHFKNRPFELKMPSNNNDALEAAPTMDQGQNPGTNLDPGASVPMVSFAQAVASNSIQLKSYYLDVPLVLHWQMKPRWSLGLGSRMSWRLSSTWQNDGLSDNSFSGNNEMYSLDLSRSKNEITFLQNASNAQPTTVALRHFQIAGTAEINFRTGNFWQLRLQYHHGFSNLLDSQNYQLRDRGVWLGIGKSF